MSTNYSIHIPKPDIFSFSECLHFLDRGYDDCLYSIEGDRIIKPLLIEGSKVLIQVRGEDEFLIVEVLTADLSQTILREAAAFVIEWFDLNRNLLPFYQLLNTHNHLSYMSEEYFGLRLLGIPDLFEALCWCVIGQQINLSFAHRLKRRLVESYGSSITYRSKSYYYFPSPELLADLKEDDLKCLQFSRQKAEYIIGIAREFAEGNITKQLLAKHTSSTPILRKLMHIRGVGEWTANYVSMKSLKRMNCITFGDSGLNSAVSSFLGLNGKPTKEEVEKFFKPFLGWESYLVIYLWRTLS